MRVAVSVPIVLSCVCTTLGLIQRQHSQNAIPDLLSNLMKSDTVLNSAIAATEGMTVNKGRTRTMMLAARGVNAGAFDIRPVMAELLRDIGTFSTATLNSVDQVEELKTHTQLSDEQIVRSLHNTAAAAQFQHLLLDTLPAVTSVIANTPSIVNMLDNAVDQLHAKTDTSDVLAAMMPHVPHLVSELKDILPAMMPAEEAGLLQLGIDPAQGIKETTDSGQEIEETITDLRPHAQEPITTPATLDPPTPTTATTTLGPPVTERGPDGKHYAEDDPERENGFAVREEVGLAYSFSVPAACQYRGPNQTDYCLFVDFGPWGARETTLPTDEAEPHVHPDFYWVFPFGLTMKLPAISVRLGFEYNWRTGSRLINIPAAFLTIGQGSNNMERTSTRAVSMSLYGATNRVGVTVKLNHVAKADNYDIPFYKGANYDWFEPETDSQHQYRVKNAPRGTKIPAEHKLVRWKVMFLPLAVSLNFGSPSNGYTYAGQFEASIAFASTIKLAYFIPSVREMNRLGIVGVFSKPWGSCPLKDPRTGGSDAECSSQAANWGSFTVGVLEA